MKKLLFSKLMLLLMASVFFTSCSDDEADPTPQPLIPNLEGFYVYGTNTIAEDALDPNARMSRAVLDPSQGAQVENMEGVYGKFMYIGANSTIQFTEVEGEEGTVYGAANGGTREQGSEVGNVGVDGEVIHGTLEANGPAIEVSEEGLYYLFVDTNEGVFVLMPVRANMIGDATEGQWETGTSLPLQSVSPEGAVFEATDVTLFGESGYRYRFNEGWHAYASPNVVTLSSLGVEDYGTAWDTQVNDLGYYLDNIPHHETGVFTIRLEFDAESGEWTETKTRTGNVQVDHSETAMGLFGNAFEVDGVEAEWNAGYGLHTPAVDGGVYTWTWESAELIAEREFIFLENGEWGGLQIDFSGATVEGEAIENGQIVDATSVGGEHHNFMVVEGGAYDIELVIDEEAGSRTITIAPAN